MTYDQISHLIVSADLEGSKMFCTFQHPTQDRVIESEAPIRRSKSVQSQVTRTIKRNVSRELRRSTSRMLRSALGGGFLGRTASQIVRTSTRDNEFVKGYTQEEKQEAIVAAYQKVAHLLEESAASQESPSPTSSISIKTKAPAKAATSEFEAHLQRFPIKETYDQEILARMLAELASADGDIGEEEEEFLNSFLPPSLGTIDTFLNAEPLSPVECEEVSQKAKLSILMICKALSIIDLDADDSEQQLLSEFAEMMGISAKKAEAAYQKAQSYILESHIDTDTPRQEVFEIGEKIGLSQDEALRAQIQLKKRG